MMISKILIIHCLFVWWESREMYCMTLAFLRNTSVYACIWMIVKWLFSFRLPVSFYDEYILWMNKECYFCQLPLVIFVLAPSAASDIFRLRHRLARLLVDLQLILVYAPWKFGLCFANVFFFYVVFGWQTLTTWLDSLD